MRILHVSLEYKKGVGGIKSVTTGLLPALARKDNCDVSIVTPFYDVYNGFYQPDEIVKVATITHIYKGKEYKSDIFQACNDVIDGKHIYHYLIKPVANSPVARLFEIKDEKNIYQAFPHSEPRNRLEYFNGATAAMVRIPHPLIPEFDILHEHTWCTGLAGCLIKLFEQLPKYQPMIQNIPKLNKIPYVISIVHMLLHYDTGKVAPKHAVQALLDSVGLPEDFADKFSRFKENVNRECLSQTVVTLSYSDQVVTVSRGLAKETISGKGEGLDDVFQHLHDQTRLHGITNGITVAKTEATSKDNLQDFAFNPNLENISAAKQRLKEHLAKKYSKLDPKKMWFLFIGRFAAEKGVEYLQPAAEAITAAGGIFIIMGMHVVTIKVNGVSIPRYKEELDSLNTNENVLVIDDPVIQKEIGQKMRAAADCMQILSLNEACGLIPPEGFSCAAFSIAPNIQGLPDSVKPIDEGNFETGTGFLYDAEKSVRVENIKQAISQAAQFYKTLRDTGNLNAFLRRLMITSKQFDWDANPAQEYANLYQATLKRPVLTAENIANMLSSGSKSILEQFNSLALTGANSTAVQKRVFQIGFNKCGTQTIHDWFWAQKIKSIHYGYGKLASKIQDNYENGLPLIPSEYAGYIGFFDMENIYDPRGPIYISSLFKELDKQYPGSKFILNTRNRDKWIKSRCAHVDIGNGKSYVDVLCTAYGISKEQLIEKWCAQWDKHHREVLEYFSGREQDLLIFNIEEDQPEKISSFLNQYGMDCKPIPFKHLNRTATKEKLLLA